MAMEAPRLAILAGLLLLTVLFAVTRFARLRFPLGEHLPYLCTFFLAFGVAFELPVLGFFLAVAGIVDARTLLRGTPYAVLGVFVIAALLTAGAAQAGDLAVGAKAPDFALAGSDGREHRLAEYVGKQGVVLAWFPKAFTPG